MNSPTDPVPAADSQDERHELFVRSLNASHDQLLAYLISLLGNRHDAEDVLQLASVTMWRRFQTFTPGTKFVAWAATVAFYESREFRRLKMRSRLYFDDALMELIASERVADLVHSDERAEALGQCLGQLDESAQKLIEVAYFGDGSLVALAAQLGRAPQTLYNKLNVLRRALAECVERRLGEAQS